MPIKDFSSYNNIQFSDNGTKMAIGGRYWKGEEDNGGIAVFWDIETFEKVLELREPNFDTCQVFIVSNALIGLFYNREKPESMLVIKDSIESNKKNVNLFYRFPAI